MKNCKDYRIFKFKNSIGIKTEKQRQKSYGNAKELVKFKQRLIEKFSGETFDTLSRFWIGPDKTFGNREKYKKEWLSSPFDIGIDMLCEKYGLRWENHWDQLYVAIPLKHPDLLAFVEEIKPDWATVVKKI